MERNIILAGVGGQGILSIAFVIDNAALALGLHFKQAEVHGMSQRGGAVQSHLRLASATIHSDLVPHGKADLVLSVEPLEALRYVHHLSPTGVVVASTSPVLNIEQYPPLESVHARLLEQPRLVLVDGEGLARQTATPRAQNMVLLGAAAPYLALDTASLETYVRALFQRKGERVVEQNVAAFRAGVEAGAFFTACLEAGISRPDALAIAQRLSADGIDPASVPRWKTALEGERGSTLRERLLGGVGGPRVTGSADGLDGVLHD